MTGEVGTARIGISGWRYAAWRGPFYPPGLTQRRELGYAAERLGSIEINGTFYSLQRPSSFRSWRDETPTDFVFAVKGGRYLTHLKRLRDVRPALANFFASGVLELTPKLGPFLWQLPPQLAWDPAVVADFLALLPATAGEAAALAAEHEDRPSKSLRPEDRWSTSCPDPDLRLRHAFEVRHPSFANAAFVSLLADHGAACVLADAAGDWPRIEAVTADFCYARLHGATELYASGYDSAALDAWAARIRDWTAAGLDAFVYFDNDMKVRAPVDAMALIDRLNAR
ncbi:uncharacterized protein YecE (DUF72 family) [Friedmanniella endophytica]|uniref:Uncharacterized protein YecE (DUF72 family) n=1 Tax=Microlunatus kandeliicorticis TaxID=1759536 RepID=A0A7W3IRL5_9ACTN|nr:DUF72 domain-containing protein [Microlunatus kandeliicorticis]MBA8793893.1 uncharacterized protein YecE (DUF72 family) [Microlunatus kandeliicorticis]